jgi:uncharacterized protein
MSENTTPSSKLDPRAPLVLTARGLPRRAGEMRTVRRRVPAPAHLGLEMIGVPEGAELDLDLRLESVTEGVLVSGTVTAPLEGECGRCLDPFDDQITVHVQELFAYPASSTAGTSDDDEVHRMEGELIDFEPVVRDEVVLALPLTPLCRLDCAGLCPDCGQRLDDLPAEHTHEAIDPRWAGLAERISPTGTASAES